MKYSIQLCLTILLIAGLSCKSGSSPSPTPEPPVVIPFQFSKGADVSWITEMEAGGRKFYNAAGVETEAIALMKSLGMNTIRIRVWVNPSNGYNNRADVLAKAIRAKNLGMRIMINFHYSDTWADPGSQTKPAAWASQSIAGLKTSLADHTRSVLAELKTNGITPEWVQVGNETNNGMLWPDGKATVSMSNFAQLINAGYDAVKAEFPNAKVIVHISSGNDNGLFRWIIGGLKNNNAKFDVIGMSLYPDPNNWATQNFQCLTNMNDMVSTYNKEVMIVEVGMSWDSPNECKAFLTDLINKTKSVANNKGLGVLYWEPQCYNNWQGYTKGAFDNSGKPTEAMTAFAN
jgi:arabinogalactan endo-1,4-beta-galactosidase